jgi:nicotinamidase-related amidase
MTTKRFGTLYGNVPEKSAVVLLLIDVINDLEFPEGERLLRHAIPMAKTLAKFKSRVKANGFAVIYVNDNFGKWRSDFRSLVDHCLHDKVRGAELAKILRPAEDDYFVLKPAHSGFYSTTLELLLKHLEAKTLIITGVATNICVLFTVNDAFLRGYDVWVPQDCVAANSRKLTLDALNQMSISVKVHTAKCGSFPWAKWTKSSTAKENGNPKRRTK